MICLLKILKLLIDQSSSKTFEFVIYIRLSLKHVTTAHLHELSELSLYYMNSINCRKKIRNLIEHIFNFVFTNNEIYL